MPRGCRLAAQEVCWRWCAGAGPDMLAALLAMPVLLSGVKGDGTPFQLFDNGLVKEKKDGRWKIAVRLPAVVERRPAKMTEFLNLAALPAGLAEHAFFGGCGLPLLAGNALATVSQTAFHSAFTHRLAPSASARDSRTQTPWGDS